ncbi:MULTISPECIES: ABC transporter permease [unclassified Streptomyces]|uniref:ABC transporter permease n=1 Tax=unclassified Streptomyces TaxID=2593676 RepID=UPI002ED034B4|nr:ABC transporter permease [Streptomyces sp. NBC_00891]WSY04980.1 ABC transporter permease [Streptomyces sp. NBC_00890]WSZ06604.1 ABC transporter permease [Streptomyces sp. NBC_00869]WSZ25899.1 ABC transporter permease [Streptomyces sp. NBC_00870]
MTAPLTPPHRPSSDDNHAWQKPEGGEPATTPGPYGSHWVPSSAVDREELRADLRRAGVAAAVVTVAGVLMGLLWLWLAPRVPLVSDSTAVFLNDSEGEEAIGADGTFALLGLAFGAVSAGLVFWLHRRGGIWLTVGLAVGSVLGSVLAWQLGTRLGPTSDVVAHAREVGKGVVFDAPLEMHAHGVLLAWGLAAMVVHLALTAAWGPRDFEGEWGTGAPSAPSWPGKAAAPSDGA